MSKKNGWIGIFLYFLFFTAILLIIPACNALFPPKVLRLTVYPQSQGYLALINVTGAKPALVVESRDLSRLKHLVADLKTEGNDPKILILGALNASMMDQLEKSGILNGIAEFHYPDLDQKPEYLKKTIQELMSRKVKPEPVRQNRYILLRDADLIVMSPHGNEVYDENTQISFKLIRGKKSFVLASDLDPALLVMLSRAFGQPALRTDVLISTGIKDMTQDEALKFFGDPELIAVSETGTKAPIRFRTDGNKIEKL